METKHYVDVSGNYLGGFAWDPPADSPDASHPSVPAGAIEVPHAPADARQKWDGKAWSAAPVPSKAERIAARIASDPEFGALVKRMARADGKTLAQLRDELAGEMA